LSSYEKKTPIEHVLLRPGMYIGQVESVAADTWLYDSSLGRMTKESIVYNPALMKLFDEILVNAADNKQRDPTLTEIDITVKRLPNDELEVAVMNDGRSIPLTLHKTENIYIPELIFGHLLTGSNFNDKESRLTGGSHGYGAKLTNIFSTAFTVEAQNGKQGLHYKQDWTNNMSGVSAPVIEQTSSKKSFTRIAFKPDLARFGTLASSKNRGEAMDHVIRMFQRRALDVAACVGPTAVRFTVEDARPTAISDKGMSFDVPEIRSFEEYVQLFRTPVEVSSDGTSTTAEEGSGSGEESGAGALKAIPYCAVNPVGGGSRRVEHRRVREHVVCEQRLDDARRHPCEHRDRAAAKGRRRGPREEERYHNPRRDQEQTYGVCQLQDREPVVRWADQGRTEHQGSGIRIHL
jgi:DNA topoisomerase-2